ncbi:LysR family transcriptional regulator, partial [Thioclava sp. BHET1]
MTLEQLRIFIAVAEREHVTRAAHALNLTQSATSAAIAALETRHGAALFERIGRGIRLTEAGRLFLPEARAVLARAETAARLLGDLADLKRGSLVISASQTLANYWLPGVLLHFHKRHPGIDVTVSITNSTDVALAVQELHADLGFVEGPVDQQGLSVTDLGGDELYLVVAPDHPWAHQRPGHDDLKRGTWILREPGSGTRAAMAEALDSHGIAEAD